VGPYYALTIQATLARYLYSVWGPGEDRFASLAQFWVSPADVLLGGTGMYNGMPATGRATLFGLVAVAVLLGAGVVAGAMRVQPARLLAARSQTLIWSGIAVVVGVIVYNTLILGYGAQYHGMPFVAQAAGLVALAAGLSDAFVSGGGGRRGETVRTAMLTVGVLGLLGLGAYRIKTNEFSPVGAETVAVVREAAVQIADAANGGPVAILWLNGFSRYHIAYYQAQAGRSEPQVTGTEIEGPPRPGQRVEDILGPLEAQVRDRASIVVVCEDTKRYAEPTSVAPFFREGKPIVDRLLSDPSFEVIHRFRIEPFPIVVLQRRASAHAHQPLAV
jgi:hypothetical protein